MVNSYKNDIRGPYKDIRWYCEDGSIIPPKEKCPAPGGVQRARYKDAVVDLAISNHIFLGQILSTTSRNAFWDSTNNNARAKQYLLEQYLKQIDNGWVNEKAIFYRGAVQVEDEVAWGQDFLRWLLARPAPRKEKFYLVRELVRGIPHSNDDRLLESVRTLSLLIAEDHANFQNIRVKIHGQPDAGDIKLVKKYKAEKGQALSDINKKRLDNLLEDMEKLFAPAKLEDLRKYLPHFPERSSIYKKTENLISWYGKDAPGAGRIMEMAETIFIIRENLEELKSPSSKLKALDLSLKLEEILFNEINAWSSRTLADQVEKNCYLSKAVSGCGYLELWEWDRVEQDLILGAQKEISLQELQRYYERSRSVVEWGTNMTKAVFSDVVGTFHTFEPLAQGYYDASIRSGVLLRLGQEVGNMHILYSRLAGLSNHTPILSQGAQVRGLNPGFAKGELVVIEHPEEDLEVDPGKIYVFNHPPSDLKPVAGIMTVTEGNMVSHVQLLARNLAIPNAVLSDKDLEELKNYGGKQVFLAVSNKGSVILKEATDLTPEEDALFAEKVRNEERVDVPVEKLQLDRTTVIDMRDLDAGASGIICGPKAANLAQLKKDFPENVVEGIVIPFGIFRKHMDQKMPVAGISYWQFLKETFAVAKEMESKGMATVEIEEQVLCELEVLRNAIKEIKLMPGFVADLKASFKKVLANELGDIPVFLRSDTNMEDLKDFTGAGLNLTLFNVLEEEKILEGIKAVWASPYSERSFKWRQKYLLNPENVFPSILIIPSVNVDYSGVLITKGLASGIHGDLTVAFSLGAGGAVDGQAAETYEISKNGRYLLLAPSRQPTYRKLPSSGGTSTHYATYETPILNKKNLWDIRLLAYDVYQKLAKGKEVYKGPYDIELGFLDDKLWLFQIRPFVENKKAMGSDYLERISPTIQQGKLVSLYERID